MNIALLTAAGNATRMHQDIPKQFIHVENKPLLVYTLEAFEKHPSIDAILVVTLPAWIEVLKAYASQFNITKLRWIVEGGQSNQESIFNGLRELKRHCDDEDVIIIHDGNRCMVSGEIISDSLATFSRYGSSVAVVPCTEAVFYSDDRGESAEKYIPREKLFRTQTPHTYTLGKLLWAHDMAGERGITDTVATCTLMQELGETVYFSHGSEENLKITTADDLKIFKALLHTKMDGWLK